LLAFTEDCLQLLALIFILLLIRVDQAGPKIQEPHLREGGREATNE
jgi:hypothetical protein